MSSTKQAVFGAALAFTVAVAAPAHAQATRTWVSGVGDDANPCSRTAPCKTFAGAISKTAAGGEIDVLDPGGFGAVTITKSISIEAEGVIAGVLVTGTNGIVVNAGPSDVVVLRGLTIEGLGTGLSGILFSAGGALHVEDCRINNFIQKGINFAPSGPAQLLVKDSVIRGNLGASSGGILVKPGPAGTAMVSLSHVRLERNLFGLRVEDHAIVDVSDSGLANNTNNGLTVITSSAGAQVQVSRSTLTNNTVGVNSVGGFSAALLSGVTITANTTGLVTSAGGAIVSYGNNANFGNASNGAPTTTINLE